MPAHDRDIRRGQGVRVLDANISPARPHARPPHRAAHVSQLPGSVTRVRFHMQKISRGAAFLLLAYTAFACTPRHRSSAERPAFDPLEYPGDSALTCRVMAARGSRNVMLYFTGRDSSPTMQRQITAVFDAVGGPRLLDLTVPEPGRKPPRAHWLRVQFQPEVAGSRTVVDSGGGESIQSIIQAADAAAQPMGPGEITGAQSFMRRLWARRCNFSQGARLQRPSFAGDD